MSAQFSFGPFVFDPQRGVLLRDGRPVAVSGKGLQLLQALVSASGQVLTKTDLMRVAWGNAAVEVSLYATKTPLEFAAEVFAGVLSGMNYSQTVRTAYGAVGGPTVPNFFG